MTVIIYTENETTGALKLIAEVEGEDNPALALDALFDAEPKRKDREFVTITGSLEDGVVERITLPDEEPEIVQPRRRMIRTRGNAEEDAPAPAKRSTRRSTAAKAPAASGRKKPGPKPGTARKKPGPKPGTKRGTTAAKKPAAKAPAKKAPAAKKPAAKSPVSSSGRASGRAASASAAAKSGKKSPFGRNAASDE